MRRTIWILIVGVACFGASDARGQGSAPAWSWPQKAKNLKVLPKDSSPEKLRAVMRGFSRSLGVRCSHCHVGKEGEPLSTYDFASDKNPKKDVARGMMRMLRSVNDQLMKIQPDKADRVNMACQTCHRGLTRPRTLAEELTLTYDKAGADSAVAEYRSLRFRYLDAGAYDFREGSLEDPILRATAKKDWAGAVALCRLGAEMFPGSAGAHANLGDAALAAGDTVQAIAAYERAVSLDPKRKDAADSLERLRPTRKSD